MRDVTSVKRSSAWLNMESKNLSHSLKVNEFVALTTRSDETESRSWHTGYTPNNVWSGLKQSRRVLALKFVMLSVRSLCLVQLRCTVRDSGHVLHAHIDRDVQILRHFLKKHLVHGSSRP